MAEDSWKRRNLNGAQGSAWGGPEAPCAQEPNARAADKDYFENLKKFKPSGDPALPPTRGSDRGSPVKNKWGSL